MGASHEKIVLLDISGIVSIDWRHSSTKIDPAVGGFFVAEPCIPLGCCFPRPANDNRDEAVRTRSSLRWNRACRGNLTMPRRMPDHLLAARAWLGWFRYSGRLPAGPRRAAAGECAGA